MDLHQLSPYYHLFSQIIDKNLYIEVSVLTNANHKEPISDIVLIRDVYYGDGNLLVKYFSTKFQIILVVPHSYFKAIMSQPISGFLNKDNYLQGALINAQSNPKQEVLEQKTNIASSQFNLNHKYFTVPNQHLSPQIADDINTGLEGKFIFTVSTLTNQLKQMIVKNFYSIWVRGEVDDAKLSSNGHLFFNLHDKNSSLSCVIYSGQLKKIKFKIVSGVVFECFGNLTLYEKRGVYQLVVERLTPEGQGDLNLAFKQLQDKLKKEGLFSSQYKKPIPRYPNKIGIITSVKGAALYDFLKTTENEFPNLNMIIFPCLVQGEQASESIAKMIEYANRANKEQNLGLETLVLTRGGGSSEDLYPFNEETTAKAIFKSEIPIISAIGHEVDWSIADMVADYRSATPTAAARFLCKGMKDLEQEVFLLNEGLRKNIHLILEGIKYKLKTFSPLHFFNQIRSLIKYRRKSIDYTNSRLYFAIRKILSENMHTVSIIKVRLDTLSPEKAFKRGYFIVKKNSHLVSSLAFLKSGDVVEITSHNQSKPARIL